MILLSAIPDWQISLLIQAGGALFSAGCLVATIKFHGKEIKELKKSDIEQNKTLGKHGEDLAGLKVFTHYPGAPS